MADQCTDAPKFRHRYTIPFKSIDLDPVSRTVD